MTNVFIRARAARRLMAAAAVAVFGCASVLDSAEATRPLLQISSYHQGPGGGMGTKEFSTGRAFASRDPNVSQLRELAQVKTVFLSCGDALVKIGVAYADNSGRIHFSRMLGGTGEGPWTPTKNHELTLEPGEYLVRLVATAMPVQGKLAIAEIRLTTSNQRSVSCDQGAKLPSIYSIVYEAPPGMRIQGFEGLSSEAINAIGVYMVRNMGPG